MMELTQSLIKQVAENALGTLQLERSEGVHRFVWGLARSKI